MYKNMLRRLKEECGISYAKMAELIGMNASTLRGVMNEDAKEFSANEISGIRQMVTTLREILDDVQF